MTKDTHSHATERRRENKLSSPCLVEGRTLSCPDNHAPAAKAMPSHTPDSAQKKSISQTLLMENDQYRPQNVPAGGGTRGSEFAEQLSLDHTITPQSTSCSLYRITIEFEMHTSGTLSHHVFFELIQIQIGIKMIDTINAPL